jgi:hypothetical protein
MPILASRGCPYQCTFCSSPAMFGTLWLARDPKKVLDEIERYLTEYRADNIDFYDLTMIIKKSWILEFCSDWFALKLAVLGVQDVPVFIFSPYAGSELFKQIQIERFSDGLNDDYYRSLVAFMDVTRGHDYCDKVGRRELSFWRFAGMAAFYLVSFTLRPWRLFALFSQIAADRSETILAQRAGAIVRRWRSA